MELILASSSPARQALLRRLQIPFKCHSPDIDETPLPNEHPDALAFRLAAAKAQALQTQYPRHCIIGSDQVATHDGMVPIGKPLDVAEAFQQLRSASGQRIQFLTAVSLLNTRTGQQNTVVVPYTVYFRDLDDNEIRHYLDREDVLGCAGSFKSEGLGSTLFARLEGGDPTSLIGLPLIQLNQMLLNEGINPLN